MDSALHFRVHATPPQHERLQQLQSDFARMCNAVTPVVRERRLWHRVTLHHLMYRSLRDAYPDMGSQMVCNAIYTVCRNARLVYQDPVGPYSQRLSTGEALPLLRFEDSSPVLFDRRTLSLRDGVVSLYTPQGRMRCACDAAPEAEARFRDARVHEVQLQLAPGGAYELAIDFIAEDAPRRVAHTAARSNGVLPGYLRLETVQ